VLPRQVSIISDGSLVVGLDGRIVAVGTTPEIKRNFEGASFSKILDASGQCVLPGLVDSHTHPIWCGDRCHEFAMKLAGR
jgi:imidazolonepropionase